METTSRKIDWLAIDLANQAQRKAQASRALSLEERVRLSLEKGEKLLAEARRAANRGELSHDSRIQTRRGAALRRPQRH
jgi:hypothetical protein